VSRLPYRFLFVVLIAPAAAASGCAGDSPAAPSRQPPPDAPSPTLPPLAEGPYRLLVRAVGPSAGCQVTEAGVPLGGPTLPPAGYFSQDVELRADASGWSITPTRRGPETTLNLAVTRASWPDSLAVTGVLSGESDQRAYDGPAIEVGDRNRPAAFIGTVAPNRVVPDGIVLTGTVDGRLTFGEGWTGQVTVCRSASVTLQHP
jgi:hypothetical protein